MRAPCIRRRARALAALAFLLHAPAIAGRSDAARTVEAVSPSLVTVSVLFSREPGKRGLEALADAVRIVRPGSGTTSWAMSPDGSADRSSSDASPIKRSTTPAM